MPSSTKDTMIAGAVALLGRRGMTGTSFGELLATTGAPRGSLYHHFPGGKDQLIGDAAKLVRSRLLDALENASTHSPHEVIKYFTSLWRRVLSEFDFEVGCAIAAITVDAGPDQPEMLALTGSIFTQWQNALAKKLVAAGVSRLQASELALFSLVVVEGALIVCRSHKSLEEFDAVASLLLQLSDSFDGL